MYKVNDTVTKYVSIGENPKKNDKSVDNNTITQHVFIGGCHRSGTTLLGSMIGAHSNCICVPESQFKIDVLSSIISNKFNEMNIRLVAKKIENHFRFKLWEMEMPHIPHNDTTLSYPKLLDRIVEKYSEKVGKSDANIWVDHTPANICYVNTLMELFPNSKFIHIVRDGRAVASSIMKLGWGPNEINKAAHFWNEKIAYGLAAELHWGKDRVLLIRYEDLLTNSEATMIKICQFLNIDYQRDMIEGLGFRVPDYTSKQHALVGQKPNQKRINDWEVKLKPRQIEIFESTTHGLLTYFGYQLKYGLKARGPSRIEKLVMGIKEVTKSKIINKFREYF